ncbi:MAG TPA: antibiotic biosynthesis monooxygenase [Mycobacterium sp.]|nr:antibiotic biosynthesis monooxygenase [Mycobacterium sp.]
MYARSTTIEAQPESIDAGTAYINDEVMPALETMTGCVGLSLLVDRESGRCIATSAWDSEEAMRASADDIAPIRDRAAEAFGGRASVQEWEIAVLHRDHHSSDGACVRATWLKAAPGQLDRAVEFYKESVLGSLQELEGFCSASLLIDRASGRAVSSTTFDSNAAMDGNREQARSLRTERLRDLGADQIDVCEFELAVAHLRAPELT